MRVHALKLKTFLGGHDCVPDPFDPSKRVRVRDAQILGHKPIVECADGSPVDENIYAQALIRGGKPDEISLNEVAAREELLQSSENTERISPRVLAHPNIKLFSSYYESKMAQEKGLSAQRSRRTLAALRYNMKYAFVMVDTKPKIYEYATGKMYNTEDLKKACAGDNFFVNRDGDEDDGGTNKATEPETGNKRVNAFDAWFTHPARANFRDVVIAPNGRDANGCEVDLSCRINLWRGPAVAPRRGDWNIFRGFLEEAACSGNTENYRYLIGWMAHMFQFPEEKPGVALGMIGGEGTGKGTTGHILIDLWGYPLGVYTTKAKHFAGDFAVARMPPACQFHDESTTSDKKVEAQARSLISDTKEQNEGKGENSNQLASYTRYVFATNDPDGFAVHSDDRRHFVLSVDHPEWKNNKKKFAALRRQMYHEGGLGALLYDLMYRVRLRRDQVVEDCWLNLTTDNEDFDVRSPPMTDAKRIMIKDRLPPFAQAVFSVLKERRLYARGVAADTPDVDVSLNFDAPTWIDKDAVEAAFSTRYGKVVSKTAVYQKLVAWGVVDKSRNAHKARGEKAAYRFCPVKESAPKFIEKHKLAANDLDADNIATPEERVADAARGLVRLLSELKGGVGWTQPEHLALVKAAYECQRQADALAGCVESTFPAPGVGPNIVETEATLH